MSVVALETVRRVRELLPWYVNGTLGADERAEVERILAQSELLRAEVAWLSAMRGEFREQAEAALPPERKVGAEPAGLEKLLALARAQEQGQVAFLPGRGRASAAAATGWNRWGKPLLAVAAALVLAQAVVIGQLVKGGSGTGNIVPASGDAAVASGVQLQVVFRDTATERELRAALTAAGVEIVGGPGQLGVYKVRAAPDKADAALAALQQNRAVESVGRSSP
jgi:anti-sigma factor RsiW